MEKALEKHLDETMNTPGVVGVLCADKQGLCLGAKGNADSKAAGLIASLAEQSRLLHPDEDPPVVCLESDKVNILIKTDEEITMAIYKIPT